VSVRDEIADLVHLYADAVTRRDFDQWTDCWAEDATWSLRPGRIACGRPEIVALLHAALATLDGVVQQVLDGMVDVQSDDSSTASGRWHLQEHLRRTDGQAALLLAHYDDRYVHRGDRWRFASRTLVTHYQGPADLSGHFTINEGIVQ